MAPAVGFSPNIPTHCLLIETERGLVLADTGYGMQGVQRPYRRLSRTWPAILNVRLEIALRQIEALGFSARDAMNPHVLRHATAMALLQHGVDGETIDTRTRSIRRNSQTNARPQSQARRAGART
jgi:hypothetical protein